MLVVNRPSAAQLAATAAVLLALAIASPLAAVAGAWAEHEPVSVRLVSRWAAAAGGDAGLGVEFRLVPGWHVYWKNAGDAGYAPKITRLSGALAPFTLRFPAPHRFELPGDLVAVGYEGAVVYPIDAALSAASGAAEITAEIDYLACAEQCIPYRDALALTLPVGAAAREDPETAPLVDLWRARLPRALLTLPGGEASATLQRAAGPELDLELTIVADELAATTPDLFFEPHPLLAIDRPAAGERPGSWRVHLRPLDETRPLPERLALAWTATGFTLSGAPVAVEGALDLARPLSAATSGAPVRWIAALVVLAIVARLIYRRGRVTPPPAATN